MARLLAILFLCLQALLAPAAEAQVPIPALKARVTDLSGALTPGKIAELETRLAGFEAAKGSQIAVLLLPTTQPESIEQFGIRLMDAWKIGRKGIDDGVILIVATQDKRLRIEVGYGLEGALNDATAKRIIAETITPKFKSGVLPDGVTAGVEALIGVVGGEPLPAPAGAGGGNLDLSEVDDQTLFTGLAAAAIGGAILRYFLGTLLGAGIVGLIGAGAGWLFTGTTIGAAIGGGAGFFVALFGLEIVLSGLSGGGRSGGGGGGFSGGGGGGGGGGASGSW